VNDSQVDLFARSGYTISTASKAAAGQRGSMTILQDASGPRVIPVVQDLAQKRTDPRPRAQSRKVAAHKLNSIG
jgi:hypothetical protein